MAETPNYFREYGLVRNFAYRSISGSLSSTSGRVGGNWRLATGEIDGYFHLFQLRAAIQNWENVARKWKNFDLNVLATQADFGDISDIKKASASKKYRMEIELIMSIIPREV